MNLFSVDDGCAEQERFFPLLQQNGCRMEKIISTGQSSPQGFWYDQEDDEWVAVLRGEAELEFEDGARRILREGDQIFLPAHARHRVTRTANPTIWLAVFLRPS